MNPIRSLMRLASPPVFFSVSGRLIFWLTPAALALGAVGLWLALFVTPTDAQQGEVYRVLYVHVPAAWLSMFLYTLASGYAVLHWVYRTPVSAVMLRALLPTGAWMTAVALITGALWGKPTWGTYWVWLIALSSLVEDDSKVDRALALFTVVGLFNIPLIYFSVVFWNTLHQGASLGAPGAPRMAGEMKTALFLCTLALWAACAAIVLARARWLLVRREAGSGWLKKVLT
jgi:heme exporter protein C